METQIMMMVKKRNETRKRKKLVSRGRFKMTVLTTERRLDASVNEFLQENLTRQDFKRKSLWKVIAKNEIRIRTSSFKNHRKLVFISIYSLLFLWAFIGAPILFDLFMPTLAAQYSSIFKYVVAIIIESFMMTLFLVFLMYPLNNVYRESEIGFKESLLATPVRSNDIFLGEFLGKAPIYSMAVLIFAPIVVGLINPLIDLTIIQYIVIYGCVFGFVYFANLIGSIIASWLEHKISKSEKFRELGKALIMVLVIAMIAIMYAVIFFLNELMAHPELKNWLAFYPSLWFSNIILYSLDPILLESFIIGIEINLMLAISVPIITLYISYKKAETFYSLEGVSEKSNIIIAKRENIFYLMVRKLAGKKWGGLIVMQLKRFLRKKSHFARIAYVFGLIGFMTWFVSKMGDNIKRMLISSTMLIAIGGAMGSIILGHFGFIDSKDVLWVYKRSPRGIKGLVYSYLAVMLIFNIFLATFETILFSIFTNLDLLNALIFFVEFLFIAQVCMCQAMGIQCISPAFGEKDSNMKGNAMISMILMQPIMFMPILLLIFIGPEGALLTRVVMQLPVFLYIIGTSIPVLYFGMKKLNKYE